MKCDSKTKDFNDFNNGRVIFVLNNLPIHYQPDEPFYTAPYRISNLAATYFMPLGQILSSTLNAAGFIRKIYINFGAMGCCEFSPNARPVQLTPFVRQLHRLFQAGILYNPEGNQVTGRFIDDLPTLVDILPANSRKIACVHGPFPPIMADIMNFRDYLRDASNDQVLVIVIGEIDFEIHPFIDDYVQVSEFELVGSHGLTRVISEMERRWGL